MYRQTNCTKCSYITICFWQLLFKRLKTICLLQQYPSFPLHSIYGSRSKHGFYESWPLASSPVPEHVLNSYLLGWTWWFKTLLPHCCGLHLYPWIEDNISCCTWFPAELGRVTSWNYSGETVKLLASLRSG